MEFLAVFLPLALLVDSAWLVLYLHERRLVRHIRARHPAVLDELRGRPRQWYDPPEEIWVQIRDVRRKLRPLLAPLAERDPELAEHLAQVDAGERWLRRCIWIGVGLTIAYAAAIWMKYRAAFAT
jgi:hypothetical protein